MPRSRGQLSFGDVTYMVGTAMLGMSVAMAAVTFFAFLLRDGSFVPLLVATLTAASTGFVARLFTGVPEDINFREAFVMVTFSWTAVALIGAMPYVLSGTLPSPVDALFESMSGFTTTGSTVLADIEAVQPGILLWRSTTQWLGGMGFIVLGVAILPYLGVGGMQLFRLEAPGPQTDRLRPRIRGTARLLWFVYAALTLVLIPLYWFGGMSGFDAVNHALTTMPTGGFSTRTASMGAFSAYLQWVCIVFMFLGGIGFTLHFRLLTRGPGVYWRDPEWRLYTALTLVGTGVVAALIHEGGVPFFDTLRAAAFQVVAVVTTTGYGTADYMLWAPGAQVLLFLLFFVGGMAGSTAGGMKTIRVLLVLKQMWLEVKKQLHPRGVFVPKIGRRPVREDVLLNVLGFVLIYFLLFGLGAFAIASLGYSFPAAAGAAASAIGNVGPAFAELGPAEHFGGMQSQGKLMLTFLMLVGRLEIYTVLLLFHPALYRR